MLKFGGYSNLLIAVAHIIGLAWAQQMFEVTGIGKEMEELAQVHASLPYLLTIFVALVFFIFGLYGLSASGRFGQLPFLKLGVFTIAGIYIFRGLGQLTADTIQGTNTLLEIMYSLVALAIGLLFLVGGIKKWPLRKDD